MIYIYTHAYNAKRTLPRAVESIFNQTNGDFVWHLCDNASTDDTKKIILDYAEKDNRIVPELREMNHRHPDYKGIQLFWLPTLLSICEKGNDGDFFCTLDADDEYKPDFFEKTLCFIKENELDVAACGSDFIDAATNSVSGLRAVQQNIILDSTEKANAYFPQYHQFMRAIWGKLYTLSLLKRCNYENYLNKFEFPYGLDTIFCMRAFSRAKRTGILAGTSHKYYLSKTSSSYNFDDKRIICDQVLDDETRKFLTEKAGNISAGNDVFLKAIYMNALADTLKVLLKSQISAKGKMCYLKDILLNRKTQALFSDNKVYQYGLDEKIRNSVIEWLLAHKECRRPDNADITAEIIMAMYVDLSQMMSKDGLAYIISKMPEMVEYLLQKDYNRISERLRTWFKRHDADVPALTELEIAAYHALSKPDDGIFMLLIDIRKNRSQASKALDIDAHLCEIVKRYPLLKDMSASLACAFSSSIVRVVKGEFPQALDAFLATQGVEIVDGDEESYLLFAQNLSAVAENADAFVYFKKMWIQFLLDCNRNAEAKDELLELVELLPDDPDFAALCERLGRINMEM